MEKVKIQIFDNGRIQVTNATENQIEVVDERGAPFPHKNRFTLCGCGHSKTHPICDGSHKEQH
jgi:CDGSH-type Zn-finger protein